MLTSFALSHEYTMLPDVWEHGGFLVVWLLLVFFTALLFYCGAPEGNRTPTSGSGGQRPIHWTTGACMTNQDFDIIHAALRKRNIAQELKNSRTQELKLKLKLKLELELELELKDLRMNSPGVPQELCQRCACRSGRCFLSSGFQCVGLFAASPDLVKSAPVPS